jgi:MFS family permease
MAEARAGLSPALVALIAGQLGLHSAMAGLRMAAPLHVLRQDYSPAAAGLLIGLVAVAQVVLALPAGRMVDRHGYRRPMRWAVATTVLGALLALLASAASDGLFFALLCAASLLVGAGANIGLIATQRTAGREAGDGVQRIRVFSWLGMAPSLANAIGPVAVGFAIDGAGFGAAYLLVLLLPVMSLVAIARVRDVRPQTLPKPSDGRGSTWGLLAAPGMKRLFVVNWLLSSCWDAHTFAVPVLGHERGFSASTIGLVLGAFTLSVSAVRLVIPLIAHRMREPAMLRVAMLGTALVFAAYPLATSPWLMALLAVLLGLAMGSVQPMILSTLHQLTPDHRHGEAIALRSMVMNLSGTVMPLVCGLAGTAIGVAGLFWGVGAAVGAGSWTANALESVLTPKRQANRP